LGVVVKDAVNAGIVRSSIKDALDYAADVSGGELLVAGPDVMFDSGRGGAGDLILADGSEGGAPPTELGGIMDQSR